MGKIKQAYKKFSQKKIKNKGFKFVEYKVVSTEKKGVVTYKNINKNNSKKYESNYYKFKKWFTELCYPEFINLKKG